MQIVRVLFCSLALLLPQGIGLLLPGMWGVAACLAAEAVVWFPLFCGLCRGRLRAGFGRRYFRYAGCGLLLCLQAGASGLALLLPFGVLAALPGLRLAAAAAGGLGLTLWALLCTRWMAVARYADLPVGQAFARSAAAARGERAAALVRLAGWTALIVLVVPAPFAVAFAARHNRAAPPEAEKKELAC